MTAIKYINFNQEPISEGAAAKPTIREGLGTGKQTVYKICIIYRTILDSEWDFSNFQLQQNARAANISYYDLHA